MAHVISLLMLLLKLSILAMYTHISETSIQKETVSNVFMIVWFHPRVVCGLSVASGHEIEVTWVNTASSIA